ncbi:MAG: hypothetical protein WC458_01060 [Patescibacteria group bacterium]
MFDYLQQFNKLPKDLRDRVSSASTMSALTDIEEQYRVDLGMVLIKIIIKELTIKDLPAYFRSEFGFLPETADHLTRDLTAKVLDPISYYMNVMTEIRALDLDKDINLLIKEAGLVLPSEALIARFKNILATYLRGIRNKIDTRSTLAKDVKIGGLNFSQTEIDRLLKVCDGYKFKNFDSGSSPAARAVAPVTRLDEIVKKTEKTMASLATEYNLKQSLESGQIKSTPTTVKAPAAEIKLDIKYELPLPEKHLSLPEETVPPALPQKITTVKPEIKPPAKTAAKPSVATGLGALKPTPKPTLKPTSAPATISRPVKKASLWSKLFSAKKKTPVISRPLSPQSIATPRPLATPAIPVASVSSPIVNRPVSSVSSLRPQMHDIKPMPKVMGPIEELQFLDLVNFRRLGKTAAEITAKILLKIKLLEKDGYDKMVAGVRAWRESPVNRLYLRLGQEAIASGQPLKEAIAARQKMGQESLNMEEVEAMVSLNSKLVF